MAKPKKTEYGVWRLMAQFKGKKRCLTLGKIPKREADSFATNLELLCDYRKRNQPLRPDLLEWVKGLNDKHFQQLGEIGLIKANDRSLTVAGLIELFLNDYERRKNRGEVQESSLTCIRNKLNHFLDQRDHSKFRDRLISDLEPKSSPEMPNSEPVFSNETEEAITKVMYFLRSHYASATWSKGNQNLIEVGNWAERRGIIKLNPFTTFPRPGEVNKERNKEITVDVINEVIEQEPNPELRLFIVMARFLGVRMSSEIRTLKWEHVDWENGAIDIRDSKRRDKLTNDAVIRQIPMFTEVGEAMLDQTELTRGQTFVFSRDFLRSTNQNHSNAVKRSIRRVGMVPWVRLLQNLRATCENDWRFVHKHPESLVDYWIGHSRKISKLNYQQVRDSDNAAAIERANAAKQARKNSAE